MNCIVHNSMDPFNNLLIKHSNKIDKLFTINNFHRNLMYHNNYNGQIYLHNNYVFNKEIKNKIKLKNKFSMSIAFIGRLSKEKNIQAIIDGVNLYNQENKKIY